MTAASKVLAAAAVLLAVTGIGTAAAPGFIDQPRCDSKHLEDWSAACLESPFSKTHPAKYDPDSGENHAGLIQDELQEFRSEFYSGTYYMPSKIKGVVGAVTKIDVIQAINDGVPKSEYQPAATDRVENTYSEQVRRLAQVNRYVTDMAVELYQTNPSQLAVNLEPGTKDELVLTRSKHTITTFDGAELTTYSLRLVDQNKSAATDTNYSADRSRTIIAPGLTDINGNYGQLNITNGSGTEEVLVNGAMYHDLRNRLNSKHDAQRSSIQTVVDELYNTITAGEYDVAGIDVWDTFTDAADRVQATGSYEARALLTQAMRGFTDPDIVATVNASGKTYTGQLFGGRGITATYSVNSSYSPGIANIVTSNGVTFIGGGYTIESLTNKATGESVANMTAQRDLYGFQTGHLDAQVNGTRELHRMAAGSDLSGITGRIGAAGSRLFGAIGDLLASILPGFIVNPLDALLGVIGL